MEFNWGKFNYGQFDPKQEKKGKWQSFFPIILILLIAAGAGFFIRRNFKEFSKNLETQIMATKFPSPIEKEKEIQKQESLIIPSFTYKPVEISMKKMKEEGCVADGLLSGYGDDTDEAVDMINRSRCLYLHRALETWAYPPDFSKAARIMQRIKSNKIIYGMFIAEAIKDNAVYYYPDEERFFDFKKMCRKSSDNVWGEHTCKPSFESGEYRKYVNYITRRAMDLGIQSFLFGQVYYQDSGNLEDSKMKEVISDMREYAEEKNIDIVVGGQTGNITDKDYLRMFDYIEGGIGISEDGNIENGPCWSQMESCWALLWHKNYSSKARNVFLHLDWSGLTFDDMSVFARMESAKRAEILKKLHKYFTSRDMGFLMPIMSTLHKENGGCFGPSEGFYSASNEYGCKDEDVINLIIKQK
jgi:hypothetical protein